MTDSLVEKARLRVLRLMSASNAVEVVHKLVRTVEEQAEERGFGAGKTYQDLASVPLIEQAEERGREEAVRLMPDQLKAGEERGKWVLCPECREEPHNPCSLCSIPGHPANKGRIRREYAAPLLLADEMEVALGRPREAEWLRIQAREKYGNREERHD